MKIKPVLGFVLFFTAVLLLWSQVPASASPASQGTYPSPTPGQDGRIIYIVKAGDTCTELSLLYGVPVEYIRTTNLLDQNCTLREGQKLMIGVGKIPNATSTPNPAATATTISPTATAGATGSAQVCVLVYEDANGDAIHQITEPAIAGAAISLTSSDGSYSQTLTSAINSDPTAYQGMCFTDVPPGSYTVSAAAPDGYNPTVSMTTNMDIIPGDVSYISFGAQPKTATVTAPPAKGPSPLLGVIGAAFLLIGIGIGAYTWRALRRK